jgi:transposase
VNNINLIAIDLAKSVFQVCLLNEHNKVIKNSKLTRAKFIDFMAQQTPTTIVMEACYSSQYWGRYFLKAGHDVKLIPAQHVTSFVRGNKNYHNDALAIAEAFLRPRMKFVPVKSIEQQEIQTLHRIRQRYVDSRISLSNQMRGLLSDYGFIFAIGTKAFEAGMLDVMEQEDIPKRVLEEINKVWLEYQALKNRISAINEKIKSIADKNVHCGLLMSIPGIGPHIATAIVSGVGNGSSFTNARELAVWTGLTPRQISSGHKAVLVGITKRGDNYVRKQLVQAARHTVRWGQKNTDTELGSWIENIIQRRGMQKGTVAVAHKLARIIWGMLHRQESFKAI